MYVTIQPMRSTPLVSAPAATTTIVAEALLCSEALEEPRYSRPALRGKRASTQAAENLRCISQATIASARYEGIPLMFTVRAGHRRVDEVPRAAGDYVENAVAATHAERGS